MSHTYVLNDAKALAWLKAIGNAEFGLMRTPDGEEFVVLRQEQLAELDSILSDPAFLSALESGACDAAAGRTLRVSASDSLRVSLQGGTLCDDDMVRSVERGIKDALEGRTQTLQEGQSLRSLKGE